MNLSIFFLRHGQTAFSRANAFCGSGMNPGLTEDGAAMAQQFADAYAHVPWAAVYCSSLQRAVETAQPLCERLGSQPQVRDELREIAYGAWEGKSTEEVTRDYHDDHLRWTADPAWNAPTGGETAVAFAQRALHVIEEIRTAHPEGNVLVVSHKATIRIALCSLLGIDVGRFRFHFDCPTASLSKVEFTKNGPMLRTLADRMHLDERLRNLPGT
jgi:probable phosphoglycerate mutase